MTIRHSLAAAFLVACIMLGGSSWGGILGNLLLQFVAIGLLCGIAIARPSGSMVEASRAPLFMLVCFAAVALIQLFPVSPAIWSALPGREPIVNGFRLLGQPLSWAPLSLAPENSFASLLWLLPAFAMYFLITHYGGFRQRWFAWTLIATTMLSVGVGALQVAGGEGSAADFYGRSNGLAVGFFSNSNHMGTLLLTAIPFLAAIVVAMLRKKRSIRRAPGLIVVAAMVLLVASVGLFISRSLAAWGLAVPVVLTSILILRGSRPMPRLVWPLIGLIGIAAAVAILSAPLGNNLTSQGAQTSEESRYTAFTRTWSAIPDYLPLGSGIGTFVDVYRGREDPNQVSDMYMNHAHNDYLEILLEAGVPGLALVAIFLIWWVYRSFAIWKEAEPNPFTQAATVATGAILLHSLVDYPLRTAAISSLFAACVAFMTNPRSRTEGPAEGAATARHLSADVD